MVPAYDDDSIMEAIANELDLESAARRLNSLGFLTIFSSAYECKFILSFGQTVQGMHLQLDNDKHIQVTQSENGVRDYKADCISSWDDWIVFVRLLVYKTQVIRAHIQQTTETIKKAT